eukprot:gene1263-1175_t
MDQVDNTPNRHQEPRGSGESETSGLNPVTTDLWSKFRFLCELARGVHLCVLEDRFLGMEEAPSSNLGKSTIK